MYTIQRCSGELPHPQIRDMQIAELMRTDEYTEDKYVLWLVCDMFSVYSGVKQGTVYVVTDTGIIEIPQVTRKPYPNKCISQISKCNGRKKLYGVPLFFDCLNELQSVKNIVIVWDQYFVNHVKQKKINTWTKNIEVYNTRFVSDAPDKKIFTLLSKAYSVYDSRFAAYSGEFQSTKITCFHSLHDIEALCSKLEVPHIERMIHSDMNISTASLAYGVNWKENLVEKMAVLLNANIVLEGQTYAGFDSPFTTVSRISYAQPAKKVQKHMINC